MATFADAVCGRVDKANASNATIDASNDSDLHD
jgi:hypothetical protein